MSITIRPERDADHAAARRVHDLAFGPGSGEGALVDALRAEAAHVPELCLVAVDGEEVVGHVVHSRARVGRDRVLALAPMAVVPDRQRSGIGSRLAEASLARAAQTAYPLVVVLGHPGYYPRFGFEPAATLGIEAPWEVPAEAWMARRLPAYRPDVRGVVEYAKAFDAVT